MKRFIQTLQVAVFLLMLSMPMLMQAGTITSLTPNTPYYIDIAANSKVRFTYNADIAPLNQQTLVFLDVNATGAITGTIGYFSGYGSGTFCTTLSTGKAAVVLSGGSGGSYTIQYCADSPLAVNGDLGVAGNENVYGKLTVMNMLGVGTATPLANLHVVGSTMLGMSAGNYAPLTMIQNFIYGNQFYVNDFTVRDTNYNGTTSWQSASYLKGISIDNLYSTPSTLRAWIKQKPYAEKIEFGSSGSTYMSVGSNVGIGTTIPQSQLHVGGNTTSQLSLGSVSYSGNSGQALAAIQVAQGSADGGVLNFQVNPWNQAGSTGVYTPVTRMTINQYGCVGIGENNPKYLLDVKGTIRSTGVLVQSIDSFPDFVFKKEYQLPRLMEVNNYIITNGHLPNIPSAIDVKNNGMNLAEMQVKLLQKVEELTLYVIDQQKTINQQSAEIEELKEKLK